jgi:hypothetical protein
MNMTRQNKRKWILGGLALLLVLLTSGAVYLWLQAQQRSLASSPALSQLNWTKQANGTNTGTASASVAPPRGLPAALPEVPMASPAASAASAHAGAASSVWDLCGLGRMPKPAAQALDADGAQKWPPFPAHIAVQPTAEAAQRAFDILVRGNAEQRAAAHMVHWLLDPDAQGRATALQALHDLALMSPEPPIARWAAQTCAREKNACSEAVLARWSVVEPGNTAAHLFLAEADPKRRDPDLAVLAAATQYSDHDLKLTAIWRDAVPADVPPYVRQLLVIELIGFEAAFAKPHIGVPPRVCPATMPPADPRRAACQTLGENMLRHAQSGLGAHMGLRLLKSLGEPEQRITAEKKALSDLQSLHPMHSDEQLFSCDGIQSTDRFLTLRTQRGEMAALRQLAAERAAASAALAESTPATR